MTLLLLSLQRNTCTTCVYECWNKREHFGKKGTVCSECFICHGIAFCGMVAMGIQVLLFCFSFVNARIATLILCIHLEDAYGDNTQNE